MYVPVLGVCGAVHRLQPGPGEDLQEPGDGVAAGVRHHHAQHRLAQRLHQGRAQDEAGGLHQEPQRFVGRFFVGLVVLWSGLGVELMAFGLRVFLVCLFCD